MPSADDDHDYHDDYRRWHAKDVLILDNFVAMHSRNPFERPRRCLAFLGGPRQGQKVYKPAPEALKMPALTLRSGDQMPAVGTGWHVPFALRQCRVMCDRLFWKSVCVCVDCFCSKPVCLT